MNPVTFSNGFHWQIPTSGKAVCVARVSQRALGDVQLRKEGLLPDCVDQLRYGGLHGSHHVKFLDERQVKPQRVASKKLPPHVCGMKKDDKPFGDIGERIAWHRAQTALDQSTYAAKAGRAFSSS